MAIRYYAPYPLGGSDPYRPRGPHALRIGDAERDAAAADLGEHYAAGRLTLDELHERLESVFAARTYGQLARVMADLPGPGRLAKLVDPRPPAPASGWTAGVSPTVGYQPQGRRAHRPADRAGRVAALSLLLAAMLVWLFTALLFARQAQSVGSYPQGGQGGVSVPGGPWGQGQYDPFGFGK